ncbi:MAG: beta-propeller domain-containing protein [Clostridia bacterium]|nr:beta-propeller domain-containing protein [Clostridia bacterium]
MNSNFEKNYCETFDAITPNEDACEKALDGITPTRFGKRVRRRQIIRGAVAMAACLCLIAGAFVSDGFSKSKPRRYTVPHQYRRPVEVSARQADSYATVYRALAAPSKADDIGGDNVLNNNVTGWGGRAAPRSAGGEMFAIASNSFSPDLGSYFSTTNLQVNGVDEADVVKTDGKYIYALRNAAYNENTGREIRPCEITIIEAKGRDTEMLSKIAAPKSTTDQDLGGKTTTTVTTTFNDMFLADDMLVILADTSTYTRPLGGWGWWGWPGSKEATAYIYDISDKTAPVLIDSFGQSGGYHSSRLVEGILYIITNHYVNYKGNQSEPELYIPQLCRGVDTVANSLIPARDISIMSSAEDSAYSQYTVISAISVGETPERLSAKTLLGSTDTIYASGENLLLAAGIHDLDQEYGPYEEIEGMVSYSYENNKETKKTGTRYRHVTQTSSQSTSLVLFSLNGGDIELTATGEIPGRLLNQFSMDEHEGHFRIVTTVENYAYDSFEDEDGDGAWFEPSPSRAPYRDNETLYYDAHPDYKAIRYSEPTSTNALYVLDGSLKRVGALEGLAEDERVYSVRFTGDIGYFVTYKQVDPLFTVDLSNPAHPYIRSELKIPGFSEYLHPYDDGLLLGLGQNTSINEWGGESRDGLKLSMFNVSDPDNVTEQSVLTLPFQWTEASSNHKAVLVSRVRALIAFPVDGSYAVYGYSTETGFYQRAVVMIDEANWWQGSRGLFIANDFYVISQNAVYIFSVSDFSPLATVSMKG